MVLFFVVNSSSLSHSLYHFGLNRAVLVIFAIEVLRLVAHAVASVAYDWDLNLLVVGETHVITGLV